MCERQPFSPRLQRLGNLDQQSLVRFLDMAEAFTQPDLPEPPDPSCTLASVLVIGNTGRADEAKDEETSQAEEALPPAHAIMPACLREVRGKTHLGWQRLW